MPLPASTTTHNYIVPSPALYELGEITKYCKPRFLLKPFIEERDLSKWKFTSGINPHFVAPYLSARKRKNILSIFQIMVYIQGVSKNRTSARYCI
jgi:hypothetical protein